jgi:hypothetical protein
LDAFDGQEGKNLSLPDSPVRQMHSETIFVRLRTGEIIVWKVHGKRASVEVVEECIPLSRDQNKKYSRPSGARYSRTGTRNRFQLLLDGRKIYRGCIWARLSRQENRSSAKGAADKKLAKSNEKAPTDSESFHLHKHHTMLDL